MSPDLTEDQKADVKEAFRYNYLNIKPVLRSRLLFSGSRSLYFSDGSSCYKVESIMGA